MGGAYLIGARCIGPLTMWYIGPLKPGAPERYIGPLTGRCIGPLTGDEHRRALSDSTDARTARKGRSSAAVALNKSNGKR